MTNFRSYVLAARVWRLALFAIGFLTCASAWALDPERSFAQLHHTRFTARDGVPSLISSIAQTPDGFLWLGSWFGLYRFDGVRAVPFADERFLGQEVTTLATSDNGDLWVGFVAALGRVRQGKASVFELPTKGADATVVFLVPDPDGSVWVGTRDSVLNFDGQRWRTLEGPWPPASTWSEPGGIWGLVVGSDGTIWTKNLLATYYLRRGERAFEQAPGYGAAGCDFARDRQGRTWTCDIASNRFYPFPDLIAGQPIPPPQLGAAVPASITATIKTDRDGTLWNLNRSWGHLYRAKSLEAPGIPERFIPREGLSAAAPTDFFEDREGNVWIGTPIGLDRFHHANIVLEPSVTFRPQAPHIVANQEAVFVYTGMGAKVVDPNEAGRRLFRIRAGQDPELVASDIGQVTGISAAPNGDLVFSRDDGFFNWRDGTVTKIATPPELDGGHVVNLVATDDGFYVSMYAKGVYRLSTGRWTKMEPPSAPKRDDAAIAIDASGALWLFYQTDLVIARVDGGHVTEFRSPVGTVNGALPDPDGVILVGKKGIARFDGRTFQTLLAAHTPILTDVYGIAAPGDGGVWLGVHTGIARIDRAALMKAFVDSHAVPQLQLFDASDGFTAAPIVTAFNGNLVVGPDRRIWSLMGERSLSWIDPDRLHNNPQPPPVVITSAVASGRTYDMPQMLALPAGSSQIQIDYTALSLMAPERVRFRYRLSDVDKDWVDADTRRQAFYTNLPPGELRFQVIAANGDGVWNETGATLAFSIAPTFLESIWFKLLLGLALMLLVWSVYALRLRQETVRLQGRFDVRIAERERIARELHDTLLQGFQGLMLRFQSAANLLPPGGEARGVMDEALDRADGVLLEGRARVRDLRSPVGANDFPQALIELADNATPERPRFQLTVEGTQRDLNPVAAEEILRIVEEAIRNVVQHADAQCIDAIVTYESRGVTLVVRDDGTGIDEEVVARGQRAGHFGLVGMRERAERLNGRLAVSSRQGAGTDVTLFVPAGSAYRDAAVGLLAPLRRLWLRERA